MYVAASEKDSTKLQRFLRSKGFSEDPFALYAAEEETEYLPYFFIQRPYFDKLLDMPARPRLAFLFAARGAGKTTTREMMANRYELSGTHQRALVVRYVDFTSLLAEANDDPKQITTALHVRAIIRALLKVLITVPATYFEAIREEDRSLFTSYLHEFGDPLTILRLSSRIENEPLAIPWSAMTPRESLSEFVRIAIQMKPLPDPSNPGLDEANRFRAVYILVDRVDESPAGPEAALDLLVSLINDRQLLSTPHVGFKFFLPAVVGQCLQDATDIRLDKVLHDWIMWDAEDLRKMVDLRLAHLSAGNITNFGQLCHSSARQRTMARLIEEAQNSPRTLLRLCGALLANVAESEKTLIQPEDVSNTIAEFRHTLEIEQSPGLLMAHNEPLISESSGTLSTSMREGLVIDRVGGHVYVDKEPLTPLLTPQEFTLLVMLYDRSPGVVTHEDLIAAIWPEDVDAVGDEQNLRKLVSRLRVRLEPETQDRKWRFIKSSRGRGYYLKTN